MLVDPNVVPFLARKWGREKKERKKKDFGFFNFSLFAFFSSFLKFSCFYLKKKIMIVGVCALREGIMLKKDPCEKSTLHYKEWFKMKKLDYKISCNWNDLKWQNFIFIEIAFFFKTSRDLSVFIPMLANEWFNIFFFLIFIKISLV